MADNRVPNYTLPERVNAIYWAIHNSDEPLTRLEICRAIGRKKSPHLIALIEQLTAEGWLIRESGKDKLDRTAFFYRVGKEVAAEEAA